MIRNSNCATKIAESQRTWKQNHLFLQKREPRNLRALKIIKICEPFKTPRKIRCENCELFKTCVTIRNQPSCSNSSRFRTLQAKKAMFNLNENNRIVMSQHPSDMRIGVNGMCGQVRKVGLDPSNGDVYIFVGRSRQLMKILHWERGGYVMYYKRLEQGRFHPRIFLREGIGFRTMRWDELVLLMEGISPKVARRKRFPNPNGKLELSRKK